MLSALLGRCGESLLPGLHSHCRGEGRSCRCRVRPQLSVVLYMQINELDLATIGPQFETHSVFPAKTNTEFVEVHSADQHAQLPSQVLFLKFVQIECIFLSA